MATDECDLPDVRYHPVTDVSDVLDARPLWGGGGTVDVTPDPAPVPRNRSEQTRSPFPLVGSLVYVQPPGEVGRVR